jgi:sulfide:quinone oxidoreductase
MVVTPEDEPLAVFGSAAASALRPLLEARGIKLYTGVRPVRAQPGRLELEGGALVATDRVVALPVLRGPELSGLPHDRDGFLRVDHHGRVGALRDVYAAGDATAFPYKQGGLAAQQADSVAEAIAARAGAEIEPQPFRPVLRGLLLTGGEPVYLRADDVSAESRTVGRSAGSPAALWWPPAKVAGRYLAPYLATARPSRLAAAALTDRPAPAHPAPADERHDALELALMLADADADWGDYGSALRALEAAEALEGVLPPAYEQRREAWLAAVR